MSFKNENWVSKNGELYTEYKIFEKIAKKFHTKKLDTIENSIV